MTIGYESYETIVAQRHGRVLRLVLNRPEVLNAVDGRMHEELARVFRDVARDREARVVVLTGAGRAFSAGGDASWFESLKGSGEELSRVLEDGFEIIDALLSVPQPVIAMVNGHAVGLGCT
ncbi:MAG: enoyl-CoA hydratase/isomerase family protein, partial [Clostridia bacterium]|nr:enoyl-CoA hydratase/isomerase family protein [Clostridia bacterium]